MTRETSGDPHATLAVSALDERPIRVGIAVFPTLMSVLEDVASGRDRDSWTSAVRTVLTPHDIEALLPAVMPARRLIPECLSPIPAALPVGPDEEMEAVARATPDDLVAELLAQDGHAPPATWRHVALRPEPWLRRYVEIVRRALSALSHEWATAKPDFERETERVGAAAARGAVRELIAGIRPEQPLKQGTLVFPRPHAHFSPLDLRLPPQGLVLLPRLTGDPFRAVRRFEGDLLTHLDYVVPRSFTGPRSHHSDRASLEALLGPPRARILRHLDKPMTVGALAELLITVPSAVTHHAAALGSAGLVERERHGRHVFIRRSARGTALLAIYEAQ